MPKRKPITYADSVPDLPGDDVSRRLRELRIARLFAAANANRPSDEQEPGQDRRTSHRRHRTMVEEDHPHPALRPSPELAAAVDAIAFNARWEIERRRASARHYHDPYPNLKGDFMSDQDRNPPAETLREGPLKAAIWRNDSENGAYYSVTLARTYKDKEGNLQDTSNFRAKDMLGLSELTRRAHHEAMERDRAAFKEHRQAQSQDGPQQAKGHTR